MASRKPACVGRAAPSPGARKCLPHPHETGRHRGVAAMTSCAAAESSQTHMAKAPPGGEIRPRIVIDASNVCLAERDQRGRARLQNLLAVRALLRQLAFDTTTICDANLKYNIDDDDGLQQLVSRGEVLQVPAGTDGDVWILEAAAQLGARVLSNDVYRNYRGRFPWIVERRVPFLVVNAKVLIPDLAIGTLQPLVGVESPAASSDQGTSVSTAPADRQRTLVQGLIAENEALRTQREQLLAECDDLRAKLESVAATAAEATAAFHAVEAQVAALETRNADLTAALSDVHAQLALERQNSAGALAQQQQLELQASELRQRDVALTSRVSTLQHALDDMRPDAQLEQKVEKLLRETLRALKSQSEPINYTLQQATETRKAVAAMKDDTHSLAQHAEAISQYLARRNEMEDSEVEEAPPQDDAWSLRFPRVERAWLAHQPVGDQLEAVSFMRSVEALRGADRALDDDRLLAEVDALAARVGDGFSYSALWDAVRKTHSPSLTSGVVLTRTRDAVRTARSARAPRDRTGIAVLPGSVSGKSLPEPCTAQLAACFDEHGTASSCAPVLKRG